MIENILTIRRADVADRDALRAMQEISLRALGQPAYTARQIESFIAHVGTMDDYLLTDGTYFVAEIGGRLAGSGGWTIRQPGYAKHETSATHLSGATIRSVYVNPDFARRGIASRLMALIDDELCTFGHTHVSLTATLSGVGLYRALGYRQGRTVRVKLPDGVELDAVEMDRQLVQLSTPGLAAIFRSYSI